MSQCVGIAAAQSDLIWADIKSPFLFALIAGGSPMSQATTLQLTTTRVQITQS